MPKLAIAVVALALVALAGSMTYVGYLVIGIVSEYLGTGRFMVGFLLGLLFVRVPWVSQGKLRTVGVLPKAVRLPAMASLLVLCAMNFLYRGQMVPLLFVTFALVFLFVYPWMKKKLLSRVIAFMARPSPDPSQPRHGDDTVIDVEFREKKD